MSLMGNLNNTVNSLALDRVYYQDIQYLDKPIAARYIILGNR